MRAGAGARRRRRRPSGGRGRDACRTLDRSSRRRRRARAPPSAAERGDRGAHCRGRGAQEPPSPGKPAPRGPPLPEKAAPGSGPRAVLRRGSLPAAVRSAAEGWGCRSGGSQAAARAGPRSPGKARARDWGPGPRGPPRPGPRSAARAPPGAENHLVLHADPRGRHAPPGAPCLLPWATAGLVSCFFPPAGRLGAQGRGPPPGAQRHHGHGAVPVPQLPQGHAV